MTADHGEYLGQHGLWGHRFLSYQDLLHVPLLIRPPGGTQGRRIRRPVQLSDLYPTVLAMAGLEPDRPVGSAPASQPAAEPFGPRNLLALPADGQRVSVAECNGPAADTLRRFRTVSDPAIRHRTSAQLVLIAGKYKLIRSADGQRELYDLEADPGEQVNLYSQLPQTAARLEALLDRWERHTPRWHAGPSGRPAGEVLQALKRLGYVGDEPNDGGP